MKVGDIVKHYGMVGVEGLITEIEEDGTVHVQAPFGKYFAPVIEWELIEDETPKRNRKQK